MRRRQGSDQRRDWSRTARTWKAISYVYDANDRLLQETRAVDSVPVEQTAYGWGCDGAANTSTAQMGKTVTDLATGQVTEATEYAYNLQGRLARVRIESYDSGALTKVTEQEHTYDDAGIRVTKLERIDLADDGIGAADADGLPDVVTTTTYLNDKLNLTGYSQVLEERTVTEYPGQSGTPAETASRTYTLGPRVIAQYDDANLCLVLLPDGHGSTRLLSNAAASIMQSYHYDAYGNPHGFNASQALSTLLYNTEQYDAATGLQYLRARYLELGVGVFLTGDPLRGDVLKPATQQRYLYALNDPLQNLDPSGQVVVAAIGGLAALVLLGGHWNSRGYWLGDKCVPTKTLTIYIDRSVMAGLTVPSGGELGLAPDTPVMTKLNPLTGNLLFTDLLKEPWEE